MQINKFLKLLEELDDFGSSINILDLVWIIPGLVRMFFPTVIMNFQMMNNLDTPWTDISDANK